VPILYEGFNVRGAVRGRAATSTRFVEEDFES